jgi:ferredoxin-NADP reductase
MGCGSSVPAKGPGPAPRPAKGTDGSGTPEGKATNGIGGDGTIVATVAEVRQETSAVKLLRLRVPTKSVEGGEFAFRPGQWVDFYAPGVDKPGGYSIASSPGQLARDGTFDVACKQSRTQGTSHWIHDGAKPGDEVRVRVGGEFFMSTEDGDAPLLMVAGGIGISPLCAMLETLLERERSSRPAGGARGEDGSDANGRRKRHLRAVLLYSEKTEHALSGRVRDMALRSDGAFECVFHRTAAGRSTVAARAQFEAMTTAELHAHLQSVGMDLGLDMMTKPELVDLAVASLTVVPNASSTPASPAKLRDARRAEEAEQWDDSDTCGQGAITRDGRIDKKALGRAIDRLRAAAVSEGRSGTDVVAFLCGPPKMSDAMEKTLLKLGLPKRSVRLERWW